MTPASLTVPSGDLAILSLLSRLILPLAFTLFAASARYAPAAEIGLISLLQTVLEPLWTWLGVGEQPSPGH
jgi:drug/metabolite transporter (DMT)-like permease